VAALGLTRGLLLRSVEEAMDWSKFLEIARCPAVLEGELPCQGELELGPFGLKCRKCTSSFKRNARFGFPIFAPRSDEEKKEDKYEDPEQRFAERYAGLWAFGYLFLRRGEAEGFYRTINELAFTTPLNRYGPHRILEVGCGVGRTVCDYARYYQNAFIIGIDLSERMLEYAYWIVIGDPPDELVELSLEKEGFGRVPAKRFGLTNVFLAQASALRLPFASSQFDLVVSANVIDRVPTPEGLIREVVRVLKPGGYFIFADPFNWVGKPEWWDKCRSLDELKELLGQFSLEVELDFDGLVYRELLDARGSSTDWRTAVVRAVKRG
jgi:SAM-dependent methyltransferase